MRQKLNSPPTNKIEKSSGACSSSTALRKNEMPPIADYTDIQNMITCTLLGSTTWRGGLLHITGVEILLSAKPN